MFHFSCVETLRVRWNCTKSAYILVDGFTIGYVYIYIHIYICVCVACGLWGLAVQSNLAQQILTTLTHRPTGQELAELCVAVVHSKQTLRGWSAINYIPFGNLT